MLRKRLFQEINETIYTYVCTLL